MKKVLVLLLCLVAPWRLQAQDAKPLVVQGNVAYQNRQYRQAYLLYRQALEQDPSLGAAWWGEGNSLYLMGYKKESLVAYQQTLRLLPQSPQVQARVQQVQAELVPGVAAPLPPPSRPAAKAESSPGQASASSPNASWWSPMWRSALVPGWGQAYNGQSTKAWLLGGATWAAFSGVVGTYVLGMQAANAYESATNASDAVDKYNAAYDYYIANQTFYIVFGLLYTSNILDAALNANATTAKAAARAQAALGGAQLALIPGGVALQKEWTW